MKKRIVFLSQWFDPEPCHHSVGFVKQLVAAGYEVDVVTGFPNYPYGTIYDGYKIRPFTRVDHPDGFRLTRVALYPSHDSGKISRICNYVSFFLSSLLYLIFFQRKADAVFVYHPPLTVGLAAAFSKVIRRWPVILEIQDLWPDTLKATGMIGSQKVLDIVGWWARWLYRRVNFIILQSHGFRRRLEALGVPASKMSAILNWTAETELSGQYFVPDGFHADHTFRVLFAGNVGLAQSLDTIVDAAQELHEMRPDIGFYILGDGADKHRLQRRVTDYGLKNIIFLPRVPSSEVQAYFTASDAVLVHLADDPLFDITIPSKLQAYLYAGKPILMGIRGDCADIITDADAGLLFAPEDATDLTRAVTQMADMPAGDRVQLGINGKQYYTHHLSEKNGMAAYLRVVGSVVAAE